MVGDKCNSVRPILHSKKTLDQGYIHTYKHAIYSFTDSDHDVNDYRGNAKYSLMVIGINVNNRDTRLVTENETVEREKLRGIGCFIVNCKCLWNRESTNGLIAITEAMLDDHIYLDEDLPTQGGRDRKKVPRVDFFG
jgi:hypothetical protein